MSKENVVEELFKSIRFNPHQLTDDTAHIQVHGNRVVGAHLVPGFHVDPKEREDGIEARIAVDRGVTLEKPVHVCFGLLPETGRQHIQLDIRMAEGASASVVAHCTFPNATDVRHTMDAVIRIEKDAKYSYLERHVHGPAGGVLVIPKAKIVVAEGARFATEFVLLSGRVGKIDLAVDAEAAARAVVEMKARISGRGTDEIGIDERCLLAGEAARGVLTSYIAVREDSKAEVLNTLTATAPYARGHVDCKEIVQDRGVAKAVPIVHVLDPKAHVTHEAAIGSVDSKQLQTLMSRGLSEDEAVELIIEGLLS